MSLGHGSSIVRDGLVLHLDAANKKSYPGGGTIWKDLSGNINGTLNGVTHSHDCGGCMLFDGTSDITLNSTHTMNRNSSTLQFAVRKNIGVANLFGGGYNNHIWLDDDKVTGETLSNCNYFEGPVTEFSIGEWFVYSMVFDVTKAYHYKNDVFLGEAPRYNTDTCGGAPVDYMVANTSFNKIGTSNAYVGAFSGYLGVVHGYDVALTHDQIKQNFNALRGRYMI